MHQIQSFNDNAPYTKILFNRIGIGAAHTLYFDGKHDRYFLKRNGKMSRVSHDVFYIRVFLREVY
jgi:hypothetical protein